MKISIALVYRKDDQKALLNAEKMHACSTCILCYHLCRSKCVSNKYHEITRIINIFFNSMTKYKTYIIIYNHKSYYSNTLSFLGECFSLRLHGMSTAKTYLVITFEHFTLWPYSLMSQSPKKWPQNRGWNSRTIYMYSLGWYTVKLSELKYIFYRLLPFFFFVSCLRPLSFEMFVSSFHTIHLVWNDTMDYLSLWPMLLCSSLTIKFLIITTFPPFRFLLLFLNMFSASLQF